MAQDPENSPIEGKPNDGTRHDHERVDAMMPWINRDQLEGEDRDLVSDELSMSPTFQAKLAQEGDLASALDAVAQDEAAESAADVDAAWAKFKARLPERSLHVAEDSLPKPQPLSQSAGRPRASGVQRTSPWRRFRLPRTNVGWLATAQTAALAALAFLFIPGQLKPQEDEYRLLSSDDPTAQAPMGNVVLMFDPASDQATMQALLAKVGARIVDGPMENGGYVLVIEADDLEAGLATLQASEAVVLAQPLGAEGVR